jgi:ureidoglycolate lyase
MRTVTIEPITDETFAPFGQLMAAPEAGQKRVELIEELQNLRDAAKPRLSLAIVAPTALPLVATQMERHPFSSQAFVPYECDSYMVLVAPHHSQGGPDPDGLKAFRVPGNIGINYSADTWHHPLTALERSGRFVVLTFVNGTQSDEEFVSLPQPVLIAS